DQFVKEMRERGDQVLWLDDLEFLENWKYGEAVLPYMGVYIGKKQLQVVGEITPDEFSGLRARYPAFVRLFKEIHVAPFSDESRRNICAQMLSHLRKHRKIKLEEEDFDYVGRLMLRFFPERLFPGDLTSFLERAVELLRQSKSRTLDRQALIEAFADFTGLSPFFLKNDLLLNEAELETYFNAQIIGQPDAVKAMCDLVKIFKSELNDPGKPIAVLHFVGPTGVGKTKSAQVLAEYFFGQGTADSPLIRVDMSEYKDGFRGINQENSPLVKGLKKKKFSVILLDEFDKASLKEAFRLMNAFDEGRMKDQTGQTLNFRNSIIILTSNIGTNVRRIRVPGQTTNAKEEYLSEIKKYFPPEIFNRIDQHIVFNPLKRDHIRQITRLELEKIPSEHVGLLERNLKTVFSEALVEYLAQNGFDEKYGARPLQRTIRNTVVAAISHALNREADWKNGTLFLDIKQEVVIDFQRG
ncbi:MAG: ATP-dependent Clp protease ATP-binding subunit, partial [Bacteroidetes bacterium]